MQIRTVFIFLVSCLGLLGEVTAQQSEQIASLIEASRLNAEGMESFDVSYTMSAQAEYGEYGYRNELAKARYVLDTKAKRLLFVQQIATNEYAPPVDKSALPESASVKLENRQFSSWVVRQVADGVLYSRKLPEAVTRNQMENFDLSLCEAGVPVFELLGFSRFPQTMNSNRLNSLGASASDRLEAFFEKLELNAGNGKVTNSGSNATISFSMPDAMGMLGDGRYVRTLGDSFTLTIDQDRFTPLSYIAYRNVLLKDGQGKRYQKVREQYDWMTYMDTVVIKTIVGEVEEMRQFAGKPLVYQKPIKYVFDWHSINTPIDWKKFPIEALDSLSKLQAYTEGK